MHTEQISEPDVRLFTRGRIVLVQVTRFMGGDRITLGASDSMSAAGALLPGFLVFVARGPAL